jgi:hypothetical protein
MSAKTTRLHEEVEAVCPIIGVVVPTEGNSATVTIQFAASATGAQKTAAQNVVNTFDWSDAAQATWTNTKQRSGAITKYTTDADALGKLYRAVMLVAVDELNILRQWVASLKTQVAAATSLADLQARIATLPATPDRTPAQAETAIQNKINSGTVD